MSKKEANVTTSDGMIALGKGLAARRERLGKTKIAVAKSMGYENQTYVTLVEGGRVRIPLDRAKSFAIAYGLNISSFITIMIWATYPEIWTLWEAMDNTLDKARANMIVETLQKSLDAMPTSALIDLTKYAS